MVNVTVIFSQFTGPYHHPSAITFHHACIITLFLSQFVLKNPHILHKLDTVQQHNKKCMTDSVHFFIYLIPPFYLRMAEAGEEPSLTWQSALSLQKETVLD